METMVGDGGNLEIPRFKFQELEERTGRCIAKDADAELPPDLQGNIGMRLSVRRVLGWPSRRLRKSEGQRRRFTQSANHSPGPLPS